MQQWAKDTVEDTLLVAAQQTYVGGVSSRDGADGSFPSGPDVVFYGAAVQQPPHFMSKLPPYNELCFDN